MTSENRHPEQSHNLKALRQARGLTQQKVSDALGIDRCLLARWELGWQKPTAEYAKVLQNFYGVDKAVILGRKKIDCGINLFQWTFAYTPAKSGQYLAYVRNGSMYEYLLLDYDYEENKWSERDTVYVTPEGRMVGTYITFPGEVLEWTAFPVSNAEMEWRMKQ